MPEDPLITIILPTWNRKAFLGEAITSIRQQTYRNWELVVVDDGSSDGTVAELQACGDPRIQVVALNHSGNISRVRNAGAAAGSGALIAFLDSDDLWLPRKLELQVAALRRGSARWCYANYAHVDVGGEPRPDRRIRFRPENGRIIRTLLLGATTTFIGTIMVERSLFDEVGGFDESMKIRGDFDFALRLAVAADAAGLPELVSLVREHPGRTTAAVAHPLEASAIIFEKFLARETDRDLLRIARARWSRLLVDAGLLRLSRGDTVNGVRLLVRASAKGGGLAYIVRRLAAWLTGRLGLR